MVFAGFFLEVGSLCAIAFDSGVRPPVLITIIIAYIAAVILLHMRYFRLGGKDACCFVPTAFY